MTTIHDPVEWLKAQAEMYLKELADEGNLVWTGKVAFVLSEFMEYVEKKYERKGLFDR